MPWIVEERFVPDIDYTFPYGAGLAEVRETLNGICALPEEGPGPVAPYAPVRVEIPGGHEWNGGRFMVKRIYVYENKYGEQTIRIVADENDFHEDA